MKRETRWVIVGNCGLYVDQRQRRKDAIRRHVEDLYRWPEKPAFSQELVSKLWRKCRRKGDHVVKAQITWDQPHD